MYSTQLGQDSADDEADVGTSNVEEQAAQSARIKQMQQVLSVPQTGWLDDATQEAIKGVQFSRGLPQTGYPDAETIKALMEMGADLQSWSLWDWTVAWVSFRKWWLIGGAVVAGGVGYWIVKRRKK